MFYNDDMKIVLDPYSPVPLYHQLAESLRQLVESGALAPGDALPPLRQAAQEWGINLHTVRHAYRSLADAGIVRTMVPRGTIVLGPPEARPASSAGESEDFLERMLREAREHGITADDVRRRLQQQTNAPPARGTHDVVHVIECSTSQALDLARQVQERWHVTAKPWSLERTGEPPTGTLVATYFHYNDIRTRWPRRLAQVQFTSIHPDPSLAARIRALVPAEARTTLILCERDAEKARHAAADLAAVLPSPTFEIRTLVASNPATALHVAGRTQPVLFTAGVWGALGPAERADPRAIEVRYLFDPTELEAVAERLQWRARAAVGA
jgi:DNA-binding transcriptional regulator YhcF (GntR family)